MRAQVATVLACGALGALAGCGDEAPVAAPPSGTAYRALGDEERLAVAAGCRDRAAGRAGDGTEGQLRDVDPRALREQLDATFALRREQSRAVAEVCAELLPFVTPGLRVRFDGARDAGDTFTYETTSGEPLTLRGTVSPAPRGGVVVARREFGGARAYRGRIGAGGRFALPAIRLRKLAENGFVVGIQAPPAAPRKVHFSAICLDCLAAGPPPASD
jgi:hypothetical protein